MKKTMTTEQMQQVTRNAIALAVVKNRSRIIALLRSHGVNVDSAYPDDQLITAILVAVQSKLAFRNDLQKLLLATAAAHTNNFTGEQGSNFFPPLQPGQGKDGFSFTQEDAEGFFSPKGTGRGKDGFAFTAEKAANFFNANDEKDKTAAGVFLKENMGTILNTGLGTISTLLTNKSNGKIADKALLIEQEKTKQAALLAAGSGLATGAGTASTGLSTGAKIGIGVAVLAVVGVIIYFIVKKKK